MNEQEWLASTEPVSMLEFLKGKASDRTLRLFAVACCRRQHWRWREDGAYRKSIELIQQYLDGNVTSEVWKDARQTLIGCTIDDRDAPHDDDFWQDAWTMARDCNRFDPSFELDHDSGLSPEVRMDQFNALGQQECSRRPLLLRCIFGPVPFHPATINPTLLAWNDRTLPKLAQAIYEERTFDRMPILADALEDAGCTNEEVLNHCRLSGVHVRGCWALDLLLGKE